MIRRKGGGHIVNVGSLSAKVREVGSDVNVATKGAIEAKRAYDPDCADGAGSVIG